MLRILPIPYVLFEIIFIALFIAEYGLFIYFIEVIVSAILGVIFAYKHGLLKILQNTFLTPFEALKTFGASIGGFLILLPGILCDIMGFVILTIWFIYGKTESQNNYKDDIIDAQIIDEDKK